MAGRVKSSSMTVTNGGPGCGSAGTDGAVGCPDGIIDCETLTEVSWKYASWERITKVETERS